MSEPAARVIRAAEAVVDEGAVDLAVGRLGVSDKAAWIIGSRVA